jgi:hypothetical protein
MVLQHCSVSRLTGWPKLNLLRRFLKGAGWHNLCWSFMQQMDVWSRDLHIFADPLKKKKKVGLQQIDIKSTRSHTEL